jgi:hypothetical protein
MSEMEQNDKQRFSLAEALGGFLLTIGATFIVMQLGAALNRSSMKSGSYAGYGPFQVGIWMTVGIGFAQWIYIVPAFFLLRRWGRSSMATGLMIAALALFLLNLAAIIYLTRHPFHM